MFKLVAFLAVIAAAAAQTQINYEIPSGQVSISRGVQKGPLPTANKAPAPVPVEPAPHQQSQPIFVEVPSHGYPFQIIPAGGNNGFNHGFNVFDHGFDGYYPGLNGYYPGFNGYYPQFHGYNGVGGNLVFATQKQSK